MSAEAETWKEIEDYPHYEVSSRGRIRRITAGSGTSAGKLLTPLQGNAVRLSKKHPSGRGQLIWQTTVYELMLLTFVGKPSYKGSRVVFRDEDRSNLVLDNIHWYETARAQRTRLSDGNPAGRKRKAKQTKVEEYLSLMKILPKAAWPALTISQILENSDDSISKSTVRNRLQELVKLKRVTVHLDGIQQNGVESKHQGRREVGYKLAAYPMGVLTDFSDIISESATKRIKIKVRRRDAEA